MTLFFDLLRNTGLTAKTGNKLPLRDCPALRYLQMCIRRRKTFKVESVLPNFISNVHIYNLATHSLASFLSKWINTF